MGMRHIDLCCGLGGWGGPFRDSESWESIGLDIRTDLNADVIGDVTRLPFSPGIDVTLLTMSPPCTEFAQWMLPWIEQEDPDMSLVMACLDAVELLEPDWWILENSRGLHQYWKPARKKAGSFYLWGEFPPFDVTVTWKGKMQTSGMNPEKRAEIPYPLANALKHAVEVFS